MTDDTRRKAWSEVAHGINAVGHASRTVVQVKDKWTDYKSRSTMKLSKHKRAVLKTGFYTFISMPSKHNFALR